MLRRPAWLPRWVLVLLVVGIVAWISLMIVILGGAASMGW